MRLTTRKLKQLIREEFRALTEDEDQELEDKLFGLLRTSGDAEVMRSLIMQGESLEIFKGVIDYEVVTPPYKDYAGALKGQIKPPDFLQITFEDEEFLNDFANQLGNHGFEEVTDKEPTMGQFKRSDVLDANFKAENVIDLGVDAHQQFYKGQ